jgi:hypothetical protein
MRSHDSPGEAFFVWNDWARVGIQRRTLLIGAKEQVSRTTITGTQLYAILDREFKTLRPAACKNCRMPLPYWREPPDEVSANWHIGQPQDCPHGCHLVVAELLARLWTRYDIEKGLVQ